MSVTIGDPVLQRTLATAFDGEIDYYIESLDLTRFPEPGYRDAVSHFLRHKYAGLAFDLIVANGDSALDFVIHSQSEPVFAGAPVVFNGSRRPIGAPYVTGLIAELTFHVTLKSAIALQPDTTRVVVVSGASVTDRYYEAVARQQFATFPGRLEFTYLSGLRHGALLQQLATLPAHSIVFVTSLQEDAEGRKFTVPDGLERVSAAANAPTYCWFSPVLEHGIVGGRLLSVEILAQRTGELGARVLRGEKPDTIPIALVDWSVTAFDARQLRRWGISETRVPAGSTVLFADPGVWEQYWRYIIGVVVVVISQAGLIAGLLLQGARRRRIAAVLRTSEAALRESHERIERLAGGLLEAQETERARIARDLHDDVSQQIAALSMGLSALNRRAVARPSDDDMRGEVASLQRRAAALAENVRQVSHELHPAVLRHAGLVPALDDHCAEVRRHQPGDLTLHTEGSFDDIEPGAALCLYRVAQEALRNVSRHARASHVDIRLQRSDDTAELSISDDGQGFDSVTVCHGAGLGLVSINERVRLAGGHVSIISERQRGTRVRVSVPLHPSGERATRLTQ